MQEVQAAGNRGIPRVETPSRLAVATTPDNARETVLRVLAEAGFARESGDSSSRLPKLVDLPAQDNLEVISGWLTENNDAHLLLLFASPVPLIARDMSNGCPPAEALEQWRIEMEKVLALVRRHRRRLTFLSLDSILADPAAFMEILGARFGLALELPDSEFVGSVSRSREAPGPMVRMMAENAIWQSGQTRNLAAELEANALPMPPANDLTLPAVDEVYREFQEGIESVRSREQERKAKLQEENELLFQQLHQIQEELESRVQVNQKLSEKLKEAEAAAVKQAPEKEFDHLREEKSKLEARVKDLEEENELLLLQLHQVQEELESYFLNGVGTSHELEEARATIEAMCNSKSWKITRPLRIFLEKFMGAEKAVR